MNSARKFALIAGSALALAFAAAANAHPEGGPESGCGYGVGPGSQGGYAMGAGPCAMGPGPGMGPGYGMGRGMGPGYGMGRGMGPGYGMGRGMGPGYGMGQGMGPGGHMGNGMGMGGVMHGYPGDVGEELATLKSFLKITDAQQAAWQGFADSTTKQAQARLAWMEKMHAATPPQTAPERLALRNEAMKARQADAQAVAASLKKLYEVLSPEQRTVIDGGPVARGPRYGWR